MCDKHGNEPPAEVLFGTSAVMGAIRSTVEKVATANIPVLLQGETGTGKEVLAKFIHCRSPWADGPFVKVNCPAIPGTLLESELFGYEKGAFTGAYGAKPGRVELAHHGSLFLDEIAELDSTIQAKLLQLLQDGQFCRIGAHSERRVEVRPLCATNRELQQAVRSGAFRQDLFYRINVVTIELPPLRDRAVDIPMLLDYFLEKYGREYGHPVPAPPDRLWEALQQYRWPGNIRELESLAKRYVVLGPEEAVEPILKGANQGAPILPLSESQLQVRVQLKEVTRQAVKRLEREIILRTLEATAWNRKVAAKALNISYPALLYKIKEGGLCKV